MKTIYHIISGIVFGPYALTGETELSHIGQNISSDHQFDEYVFPKRNEGKTWFWTEEEAKGKAADHKDTLARIKELEKELT